jgi:hypothetical protein
VTKSLQKISHKREIGKSSTKGALVMRLVVNITCGLIGCLSIATGVFGSAYFQPPHGADPGAINAVWLTFFTLIFIGLTLVWGAASKIGRAK